MVLPKVFRFNDIDAFRSSVRNLNVDFTPLARKISAEQTILNLPGCDVNYTSRSRGSSMRCSTRTPRQWGFRWTTAFRSASTASNGIARSSCSEAAVPPIARRTDRAAICLDRLYPGDRENRGWPEARASFRIFETSEAAQGRLRRLVLQVLSVSPQLSEISDAAVASGAIRGIATLPPSIRRLPKSCRPNGPRARIRPVNSRYTGMSRRFSPAMSGIPSTVAISPGKSASPCGPCTTRFSDTEEISLHRYLRLRRLWLVRQRLLAGPQKH